MSQEEEYQLKIEQRHKNYVEYYEKIEPIKRYSLQELMDMDTMELLALMPNNQVVDEHNEKFGYNVSKYHTGFRITKTIDGYWNMGFYESHRDKLQKDQFTLFEITYARDFKLGLIDLYLMVQNRSIEYFRGIKSGRIRLMLDGEYWGDRVKLGLDKEATNTTVK